MKALRLRKKVERYIRRVSHLSHERLIENLAFDGMANRIVLEVVDVEMLE